MLETTGNSTRRLFLGHGKARLTGEREAAATGRSVQLLRLQLIQPGFDNDKFQLSEALVGSPC
jgi:hypothetical protein